MTPEKARNCPFRNSSRNTVCRRDLCALYIEEASRCALAVMGQAMLKQASPLKGQNKENPEEH